jgi:gliding motility-associated-like protein
MKIIRNTLAIYLLGMMLPATISAQVNVTSGLTANQLVARLIGENVVAFNAQLNCPSGNSGTFDVVSSNLGLNGGIILCTGDAKSDGGSVGVNGNVFDAITQMNSGPGDADLSGLVNGNVTNDACVLEFDFVPDVDTVSTLRFGYVFGSEEYESFTCSQFNDVFGFLLSGPGYNPPVNIALVPGTNIPVTINSINSGVPSPGFNIATCNAMGPGSPFPAYFVNNAATPANTTITLFGFTTVLEATAVVYPCDTYHMKLGVANVVDHALQSAVFLQENSFSVDSVVLVLDGIIQSDSGYLVEGCTPATIRVTRDNPSPQKKKICLSYGGTAINGVDYPLLPDSLVIPPGGIEASMVLSPTQDGIDEPGFETIIIRRLNCCTLDPIDSVEIKIRDSLKMELLSKDTAICALATEVKLHATGDPSFTYTWTSTGTPVHNPNDTLTYVTPDTTSTFTITATFQSCPSVSRSFTVTVEPIPRVDIHIEDTSLCIGKPLVLYSTIGPAFFNDFTIEWSPPEWLSSINTPVTDFYTDQPGDYKYYLTVTTPLGCESYDSIFINAQPKLELTDVTADFKAAYGDEVQLNASGAKYYIWFPTRFLNNANIENPIAQATDTTTFMVIGMNQWGCKDTAYVRMDIDYTMHEIIPSAFSPNGDGRNDVFRIINLKYQRIIEFKVFNRWGELVYDDINPTHGWDGTYKGVPQPPGVYYYLIRVATPGGIMRNYKGDVTLIR